MARPPKSLEEFCKPWQLYWPLVRDTYEDDVDRFVPAAGVTRTTVDNWRSGRKSPGARNRQRLAELAGRSADAINEIFDRGQLPPDLAPKGSPNAVPSGWREDVQRYARAEEGRDTPVWVVDRLLADGPGAFPWKPGDMAGIHAFRKVIEGPGRGAVLGPSALGGGADDQPAKLPLAAINEYREKFGMSEVTMKELINLRLHRSEVQGDLLEHIRDAIEKIERAREPDPVRRVGRKRSPPSSKPSGGRRRS